MLDRPERGGVALSPGLDRCKLSLNGFVAYGRVKVLGAFFQALQELVGFCLTVAHRAAISYGSRPLTSPSLSQSGSCFPIRGSPSSSSALPATSRHAPWPRSTATART